MSYNHLHNGQYTNLKYDMAHSSRDVPHTPTVRITGKPNNQYGYADADGTSVQSKHLIDHNFSHDNQHQQEYNPNEQIYQCCIYWEHDNFILSLAKDQRPISLIRKL